MRRGVWLGPNYQTKGRLASAISEWVQQAKAGQVSPFRVVVRITDMIGASISWEGRVAVDSDVARLRRGDLDALSELISRYQNRLYRYLLRMVRQPAEAEDLFQQTWVRVAERIRAFDPNRNFDAWLFTLARNLAIDHLRRVQPRSLDEPLSDDASAETAAGRLVSREPLPLERVVASERAMHVATAMTTLPVIYREVLALRFEEEMKIEEIALVVGAPLSTVKTRLRRSLKQLRRCLETQYPGVDWQ